MKLYNIEAASLRWRYAEDKVRSERDIALTLRGEFADALDQAPEGSRMHEISGHSWRKNADETWTCSCDENPYTSSGLGLLEEMGRPPIKFTEDS